MQRIGVFVCHCGSNIAATVDVKKVVEIIAKEPGVVHTEDYQYMCSEAGQSRIQEAIREKNLTGVVVCSCSPRMHEATFRKAAEKAGLNPYMVEIANIREHCSWIHKDMQEATEKAVILARAAVAKVNLNAPLQPGESLVTKTSPCHRRRYRRNPDSLLILQMQAMKLILWRKLQVSVEECPSLTRPSLLWTAPHVSLHRKWWRQQHMRRSTSIHTVK